MLFQVLTYLRDHAGAPITELRRQFEMPSEMVANLVVQLEDAGLIHSPPLSACHHLEGGGSCGSCASGGCSSGQGDSCAVGEAFERGCCGMNGPYRLTTRGVTFLARHEAS